MLQESALGSRGVTKASHKAGKEEEEHRVESVTDVAESESSKSHAGSNNNKEEFDPRNNKYYLENGFRQRAVTAPIMSGRPEVQYGKVEQPLVRRRRIRSASKSGNPPAPVAETEKRTLMNSKPKNSLTLPEIATTTTTTTATAKSSKSANNTPRSGRKTPRNGSGNKDFVAMHGGTVKAMVDSGRNNVARPSSSTRRSKLRNSNLSGMTSMLPWNNPKLAKRRIPIVSNPPFEFRKKRLSVRELAKAHQRKRQSSKKKKEQRKRGGGNEEDDDEEEEEVKSAMLEDTEDSDSDDEIVATDNEKNQNTVEPDPLNESIKPAVLSKKKPPKLDLNFNNLAIVDNNNNSGKLEVSVHQQQLQQLKMEIQNPESDDELEQTYEFTSSGAFNIQGFQIQENGITRAPDGAKVPENRAHDTAPLIKLAMLGKGASGVVHEMLHVPTLSLVAVKSIPCFEQRKRHQMIKELKALYNNLVPISAQSRTGYRSDVDENDEKSLDQVRPACPYIVAFHDAFISPREGNISIVMEYMDGGSLQDVVDAGGCDCESVLANVAECVARALLFLHNRRQIHRDIKPSNLLINHQGDVKVSDFGIVREVSEGHVNVDTFVGTMIYMSPERISGNPYSFSCDIWSYGLSLLTLALGEFPISTAGGYWSMLHSLNNSPMPSLPADKFSSEIIEFIDLCLQKDPAKRPSAGNLLTHPFLKNRNTQQTPQSAATVHDQSTIGGKEKLEEIGTKLVEYKLHKIINQQQQATNQSAGSASEIGNNTNSLGNSIGNDVLKTMEGAGTQGNKQQPLQQTQQQGGGGTHLPNIETQKRPKKNNNSSSNSNSIIEMGRCTCSFKGNKCAFCMTSSFGDDTKKKKKTPVQADSEYLPYIPKVSTEDCLALADQIGIAPGYIKKRLNAHIAKGNEYVRRRNLYNM